jgi:hypothetical protein
MAIGLRSKYAPVLDDWTVHGISVVFGVCGLDDDVA